MKINKKNFIIIVISLLLITIIMFYGQKYKENYENYEIPKIIWTYWDGTTPDIVNKCIDTWRKHNPTYEIIILNKNNLNNYLPEVDFSKMKNIENPAHFSDMVRIHVLAKNGGIWCDASIICLKSFDWINELRNKENSEFVGFYIDSFTKNEYKKKAPVIENWFFACIKGSEFVSNWRDEYKRITEFESRKQYLENVKSSNIDFQNIGMNEYLAMHISAQKILQSGQTYKLSLIKAEDDAFKYLTQNDWDSKKAIQNLVDCNNESIKTSSSCSFLQGKIIKLRGDDRKQLENINTSNNFFNKF
jgi:hypothetical protein